MIVNVCPRILKEKYARKYVYVPDECNLHPSEDLRCNRASLAENSFALTGLHP